MKWIKLLLIKPVKMYGISEEFLHRKNFIFPRDFSITKYLSQISNWRNLSSVHILMENIY